MGGNANAKSYEVNALAAGQASQVMKFDGATNTRANQQTFHAGLVKSGLNLGGHGLPSGAGYGSNLAQHSGTENLLGQEKTLRSTDWPQAEGSGSESVGPKAGNYGNGVQSFGGLSARAKGPQSPTKDED